MRQSTNMEITLVFLVAAGLLFSVSLEVHATDDVNDDVDVVEDLKLQYEDLKLHTLDRLDAVDRKLELIVAKLTSVEADVSNIDHKLELIVSNMGKPTSVEAPKDCADQPDAKDCADVHRNKRNCGEPLVNGVFDIKLKGGNVRVFCDLTDDGGNWTVIQRKFDNSISFNKSWNEYENGFGDLETNFWLGNKAIYDLTTARKFSLRIDVWTWNNTHLYGVYATFKLSFPSDEYRLDIGGHSGTIPERYSMGYNNGQRFSTYDNNNDQHCATNCGVMCGGGWWFKHCAYIYLNGINAADNTYTAGRSYILLVSGRIQTIQRATMRIKPYV